MSYLDSELSAFKNDQEKSELEINSAKYAFSSSIKNGVGEDIKKCLAEKPKKENIFKRFFRRLMQIYG